MTQDIGLNVIADISQEENISTTVNSYRRNMYETNVNGEAMIGLMRLRVPTMNAKSMVNGMRGRIRTFTGTATIDSIPER